MAVDDTDPTEDGTEPQEDESGPRPCYGDHEFTDMAEKLRPSQQHSGKLSLKMRCANPACKTPVQRVAVYEWSVADPSGNVVLMNDTGDLMRSDIESVVEDVYDELRARFGGQEIQPDGAAQSMTLDAEAGGTSYTVSLTLDRYYKDTVP